MRFASCLLSTEWLVLITPRMVTVARAIGTSRAAAPQKPGPAETA